MKKRVKQLLFVITFQILTYYLGNYIHRVSKYWAPFLFLRLLCALLTDLKNIWQYCRKKICNKTRVKFYV